MTVEHPWMDKSPAQLSSMHSNLFLRNLHGLEPDQQRIVNAVHKSRLPLSSRELTSTRVYKNSVTPPFIYATAVLRRKAEKTLPKNPTMKDYFRFFQEYRQVILNPVEQKVVDAFLANPGITFEQISDSLNRSRRALETFMQLIRFKLRKAGFPEDFYFHLRKRTELSLFNRFLPLRTRSEEATIRAVLEEGRSLKQAVSALPRGRYVSSVGAHLTALRKRLAARLVELKQSGVELPDDAEFFLKRHASLLIQGRSRGRNRS